MLCTSGFMDDAMLHIMARARLGDAKEAHTQNDSTVGSKNLKPRRILKLTHQGQLRNGGGV